MAFSHRHPQYAPKGLNLMCMPYITSETPVLPQIMDQIMDGMYAVPTIMSVALYFDMLHYFRGLTLAFIP